MTKSKIPPVDRLRMVSEVEPLKVGKLLILSFFLVVSNTCFAQMRVNPDSIPFIQAMNYDAGGITSSIFCADLDGDGNLDLVVTNPNIDKATILKNNGDGNFQLKATYNVGYAPTSVFCADLEKDGDLDLVVANYWSDDISILKNNGDGTFQSMVDYRAGDGPQSVFCADLDGDNDLDLAVANYNSDSISILKNNSDGTFQSAVNYSAGDGPQSVFCADLDGDNNLDLAVANHNSDDISILKNNGDGTFQSAVNYGAGDGPYSVFCADLDGDTHLDLAVANYLGDNVSILKNNGDGTFQAKADYGAGDGPISVFCADLDGDTHLDLAVANYLSDNVSILKNNGNGSFRNAVNYSVGTQCRSVSCADLDGDGDLDLAITGGSSVSIFKNLTVRQPVELWVDIVGRSQIRAGLEQTYIIRYGNAGNSDAEDVLLIIDLPAGLQTNVDPPPDEDTLCEVWPELCNLQTATGKSLIFIIPRIPIDGTSTITLRLLAPPGWTSPIPIEAHIGEYPKSVPSAKAKPEVRGRSITCEILNSLVEGMHEGLEANGYHVDPNTLRQVIGDILLQSGINFTAKYGAHLTAETIIYLVGMGLIAVNPGYVVLALITDMTFNAVSTGICYAELLHNTINLVYDLVVATSWSWDPNDKVSSVGFGTAFHFVRPEKTLDYIVFFENVDSATADAEDIVIVDTLDQNLDWSTLQIGNMSHPLSCSASFDTVKGIITWTCDSIMLPPDTLPPNGEGWVSFSIKPKSFLSSGTQIKNRASIKFDYNPWMYAPMDSSYVINTIDAGRPTSSVNSLPDTLDTPIFNVSWSGMDDPGGSGIAAYTVYVNKGDGSYLPWLVDTTATSAIYIGEYGHSYYFSCTAIDNVGNREERHFTFDARTRVIGYRRGDANGDGVINVSDVVYLINYLFISGPAPVPLEAGDVNCDGVVNVSDVVYLINYLFISGPPPGC